MKQDIKNPEAVSAGGIIIRYTDSGPELLLTRDKRYTAWVVPKGHVEDGETLEQAALREIKEEAGDVIIRDDNKKTKSLLIGREGRNLKLLNRAVRRFFSVNEVKVI